MLCSLDDLAGVRCGVVGEATSLNNYVEYHYLACRLLS